MPLGSSSIRSYKVLYRRQRIPNLPARTFQALPDISKFESVIPLFSEDKRNPYAIHFRMSKKVSLDWVVYGDAFVKGKTSPDHRLERHPQYRSLIVLLIDMVHSDLTQRKPWSEISSGIVSYRR